MGLFFGTDGIRGQVNDDLSQATAYNASFLFLCNPQGNYQK